MLRGVVEFRVSLIQDAALTFPGILQLEKI
jgi:hypothetical protein